MVAAEGRAKVIEENWETYSYGTEGGPVFASFYAGAGDIARDDFPFCARVIIPIKQPNESGGPADHETEVLWHLEDNLTDILTRHHAPCLLVARLTHAGSRELVFQLADWDKFRPPVGLWMQASPEYDIDVSEHDGWDFFDDCVWPGDEDWMLIHDRRVVDGLIEAGSNPEKEHSLEFVFHGDPSRLRRLQQELGVRGYVKFAPSSPPDELVMVKKVALDLDQIYSETLENRRLCDDLGVAFDGWGAAVVK